MNVVEAALDEVPTFLFGCDVVDTFLLFREVLASFLPWRFIRWLRGAG